ncbi:unnamed protein product [Agarophyton chilense]
MFPATFRLDGLPRVSFIAAFVLVSILPVSHTYSLPSQHYRSLFSSSASRFFNPLHLQASDLCEEPHRLGGASLVRQLEQAPSFLASFADTEAIVALINGTAETEISYIFIPEPGATLADYRFEAQIEDTNIFDGEDVSFFSVEDNSRGFLAYNVTALVDFNKWTGTSAFEVRAVNVSSSETVATSQSIRIILVGISFYRIENSERVLYGGENFPFLLTTDDITSSQNQNFEVYIQFYDGSSTNSSITVPLSGIQIQSSESTGLVTHENSCSPVTGTFDGSDVQLPVSCGIGFSVNEFEGEYVGPKFGIDFNENRNGSLITSLFWEEIVQGSDLEADGYSTFLNISIIGETPPIVQYISPPGPFRSTGEDTVVLTISNLPTDREVLLSWAYSLSINFTEGSQDASIELDTIRMNENGTVSILFTLPAGVGTDIPWVFSATKPSGEQLLGVDETNPSYLFSFVTTVVIDSITPLSGPEAGGTEVTLVGEFPNYDTSTVDIFFDGVVINSSLITNISFSSISFVTPPKSSATNFEQIVTVQVGGTISNGVTFTYEPVVKLESMTPSRGPVDGGTLVTLLGQFIDFDASVQNSGIYFGSTKIDSSLIQSANSTAITARSLSNPNVSLTIPSIIGLPGCPDPELEINSTAMTFVWEFRSRTYQFSWNSAMDDSEQCETDLLPENGIASVEFTVSSSAFQAVQNSSGAMFIEYSLQVSKTSQNATGALLERNSNIVTSTLILAESTPQVYESLSNIAVRNNLSTLVDLTNVKYYEDVVITPISKTEETTWSYQALLPVSQAQTLLGTDENLLTFAGYYTVGAEPGRDSLGIKANVLLPNTEYAFLIRTFRVGYGVNEQIITLKTVEQPTVTFGKLLRSFGSTNDTFTLSAYTNYDGDFKLFFLVSDEFGFESCVGGCQGTEFVSFQLGTAGNYSVQCDVYDSLGFTLLASANGGNIMVSSSGDEGEDLSALGVDAEDAFLAGDHSDYQQVGTDMVKLILSSGGSSTSSDSEVLANLTQGLNQIAGNSVPNAIQSAGYVRTAAALASLTPELGITYTTETLYLLLNITINAVQRTPDSAALQQLQELLDFYDLTPELILASYAEGSSRRQSGAGAGASDEEILAIWLDVYEVMKEQITVAALKKCPCGCVEEVRTGVSAKGRGGLALRLQSFRQSSSGTNASTGAEHVNATQGAVSVGAEYVNPTQEPGLCVPIAAAAAHDADGGAVRDGGGRDA